MNNDKNILNFFNYRTKYGRKYKKGCGVGLNPPDIKYDRSGDITYKWKIEKESIHKGYLRGLVIDFKK